MRQRQLHHAARRRSTRRGFNLAEMLIALAITSALLTATMVALNACFIAYQRTTEEASSHTVSRLALHRMLTLIRTGTDFGPFPVDPKDSLVSSDFIEFRTPSDQIVTLEYSEDDSALLLKVMSGGAEVEHVLLNGVPPQYDDGGTRIKPFVLEYELGRKLYRVTIDLTVIPDDEHHLQIDGSETSQIRLVASAMPRTNAY